MTGIPVSVINGRRVIRAFCNGVPDPTVDDQTLIARYEADRAAYLLWINDPRSADEWPYREPVGADDEIDDEYPDNEDQIPI